MRIGFFDSGVGGITVLKEAIRILPKEDFLYYADTSNVPYGNKEREQVRRYIFNAVDFIAGQGIKALVIACNTATSIAVKDLREKYNFPIIGMEPAVKPAIEFNNNKRVLVVATPLTLSLKKYHDLVSRLDSNNLVDSLPLPGLVQFAEDFIFDRETINRYLRQQLLNYDIKQYGAVVLGCTHFPFYRDFFTGIFEPGTHIIDGGLGTVNRLKSVLEEQNQINSEGCGDVVFYSSDKIEPEDSRYRKYLELLG